MTTTEDILSACGQSGKNAIRVLGNDGDTALWFARLLGMVIADGKHSPDQAQGLVSGCYSHYVIATGLRPAVSAGLFLCEVRRMLGDPTPGATGGETIGSGRNQ